MGNKIDFDKLAQNINQLTLLTQIIHSTKTIKKLPMELTDSQMFFLRIVKILETPTISQISKVMGSDPSFISRITAKLEKINFVKRIPIAKSKKGMFIKITNNGNKVVEQIEEFEASRRRYLLSQISIDLGDDKVKVIEEVVNHLSKKAREIINFL